MDMANEFKVGDGAHYSINGDSYPCTVRKVSKSGRQVWVSNDSYKVTGGSYYEEGDKPCIFTSRDVPESEWKGFHLAKNGQWVEQGCRASRGRYLGFELYSGRAYSHNPHV